MSASACMVTLELSSSVSNSVSMLFIHLAFLWSFRSRILLQNVFVSLVSGCWYGFAHSPLIVGRIFFFRCFWMSCLVLSRYPFSFPSFARVFWLVSSSFLLSSSCRAFSVFSENFLMFRVSIIIACCRSLFICDSNLSSHSGFDCLWSSRGPRFFHRLMLLLRILNR